MDKGNSAVCSAECILFFLEVTRQLKRGPGHNGSQEAVFKYSMNSAGKIVGI